jgi:hypothetical protein
MSVRSGIIRDSMNRIVLDAEYPPPMYLATTKGYSGIRVKQMRVFLTMEGAAEYLKGLKATAYNGKMWVLSYENSPILIPYKEWGSGS